MAAETAQALAPRAKIYPMTLTIRDLKVRQDRNNNPWVSFKGVRSDGTRISCVAFVKQAQDLLTAFKDGDTIEAFGTFERRSYPGAKGETVSYRQYKLFASRAPKSEPVPERARRAA